MFGLSFLNSGILFLASAGIIPLLIYLFAKKKPRKIIFSTIKFIKESQKRQRKRINIKNLLLLIIRILIIILTIFAISRPSIKAPFLNTGTLHPKTAIAVIIDNSYSMDYLVDTQTELEKAKEIAFNINNIISKDDFTILLTLDETWNNLHGNLIYGKIPQDLIQEISLTPLAKPVKDIIEIASQKLKESHLPNQEIYVISDFQAQPLDKSEIPTFFIPTSEIRERTNISCQNTNLLNDLVGRDLEKKLAFDLVNHSNILQEDVIYQLFLDGQTIAEKVTDLKPLQRKRETFKINLEKTGWHSGFVNVKNERLSFDNRNYFSFYYDLSPEIAIITDELNIPLPLETILEIYSGNPENIKIINTENLNYESLENYDNIIIYKKRILSSKLTFILNKLLKNNKGVLFIVDKEVSDEWKKYLKNKFEITFKEFYHSNQKLKTTYINPFHPITKLLKSSKNITFNDVWEVSAFSDILLQAQQYPLALEKNTSIIWLFDIQSLQNPFMLDSSFPVFAYNCLQYMVSESFSSLQLHVGNKFRLRSPQIELPSGEEIQTNQDNFVFSNPGIYKIENKPIAINLDYKESKYQRFTEKNIKNIQFLNQNWDRYILQSRYGFEIWKYLLILVILLFILEMFLIKKEETK